MATIDLIVLGMVRQQPLSAYDIQKLVEYRNISRWVKISMPSIYKKVIQLEKKGLIQSAMVREGRMAEKAVYSLTDAGRAEFERLMLEISGEPVRLFLDFNAVIVNLDGLPPELQRTCVNHIEENVRQLKTYLEENLAEKRGAPEVPEAGMAVLRQQYALAQAIEAWIASVRESVE
ncbi:MAG: PadR family transcriptional regulator [Clostridia bacterium]|nr:PadR family transcriptional regulator [Clostridia bacterium]